MSVNRPVTSDFPGPGVATTYVKRENVACNAGTTVITVPASGNFSPPLSNGMVRVKNALTTGGVGVNATTKVASVTVTGPPASNTAAAAVTVQVFGGDANASAAGTGIDEVYSIFTDISIQTAAISVTTATNTCYCDVEVAGNS
jgi:hypothetical protein